MQINIVTVKDMVQLDITGPYEVLARAPGWTVDLVSETLAPVRTDRGLTLLPTRTRETVEPSDILVVPGGAGIDAILLEQAWLDFARREAERAKYVFGICTGSLLLAAAGVLKGKTAGCHWQARDLLEKFGVTPSGERMTVDGKFYTSGGVTSGIDMALRVVADAAGEKVARKIQLAIEYDPAPPFKGGTPDSSPKEIVNAVLEDGKKRRAAREDLTTRAAANMKVRWG